MREKVVGAVLVVGGGIGGIQASLDLAEAGFKVYLIERNPSIGGVMPQLDKTFPTNDCAMCTLAPKLVDVGRHPNIEIITYAEVVRVDGEAGNFEVKVRKFPSYVDFEKCTGCGECERVCPVEIPSPFDEGLGKTHAIYKLYPQAVPNIFTINKTKEKSPCKVTCPARVNAQAYIQLISKGKFKEALDVVRRSNPFPGICGRVCHHPCEEACLRGTIDEPVAIRALKRFLADYDLKSTSPTSEVICKNEKKIAVVGGGPAGLTAAYDLRLMGYEVTLFEKEGKLGGMMQFGIPKYRLPRDILEREIGSLISSGIRVKLNVEVGKDITLKDLKEEFDAVLVATGAGLSKRLPGDGYKLEGVYYSIPFLKGVNTGNGMKVGGKVVVIGGGNVAVDCARCALRLGAKEVRIVCLEAECEMPAHPWEIREAVEEGIMIHNRWGPKRVIGDGKKVAGLEVLKVERVFDQDGRFSPIFSEREEKRLECDTLIIAIGQEADQTLLKDAERMGGVWVCGDARIGPSSVVEAIQEGHLAAQSIDRHFKGEVPSHQEEEMVKEVRSDGFMIRRKKTKTLSPKERVKDFSEIEGVLSEEEAILEAKRCLSCSVCSECLMCKDVCEREAIDHGMKEKIIDVDVGAIVLACGFEKFLPTTKHEYGYGRYRNVLTSIEFERILSASGPFNGRLLRPSDKKVPRRIAFIQCVGSRDHQAGLRYCSSVCCTYAIKEAVVAKEHAEEELDTTIFYMDIRTHGKGFEEYYRRGREKYGVRFIKGRVSQVKEIDGGNLSIRYLDEEMEVKEEVFDLVVLSVGLCQGEEKREFLKRFGVEVNEFGFVKTLPFSPTFTTRPGIFVAGTLSSPKDIPETIMEAEAASSEAGAIISSARNTLITPKEYPEERNVWGEPPRIGVFVCSCGVNIGGVVDVEKVTEYAKTLENVVYSEWNLYTCSQDTQERIRECIQKEKLNRVVVASCTPRTHQPLFQETCREAGLNKYLFEMANIRDQCSWVHQADREKATEKAKILLRMAVAKARKLIPLVETKSSIIPKALIIGGGVTGMTAAISLANQGYMTYIIEREGELGGNARKIHFTLDGEDIKKWLKSLIEQVESHPLIKVYKWAEIEKVKGYIGSFKTTIVQKEGKEEIEHGVIIVATGALEYKPKEYLYGQDKRVLTQCELEEKIEEFGSKALHSVVMIQCVGGRSDEHPYCSKVCCQQAIKNATRLKELSPDTNILILYRDIRTYGFKELFYEKARRLGIIFIRYKEEDPPKVEKKDDTLIVRVKDPLLKREIEVKADLLVLSVGIVPAENERLSKELKVPLDKDGFFLEAHVKLRPIDFARDGIFVGGLAHSPKPIEEALIQGTGAAARAITILSKEEFSSEGMVSKVEEDSYCRGCEKCAQACEFNAVEMVEYIEGERIAKVNPLLCKGCGACAAQCPSGAMISQHFTSSQIDAMVEAAVGGMHV